MRKIAGLLAGILVVGFLAGCGGGGSTPTPVTTPTAETGTVNLVVSDTPSTKYTVLSFQIQITGAVLQPGNVSLLPKPVTVDLAQLVSDTSFLSSTVIGSATYTSMTMTFANPEVTIVNNSGAAITTATQTCASGAVCTFAPKLNSGSVTISAGVFPVTVAASSTTGLSLDLSIPDLLQSDLSVTLADGTSVNVALLPEPRADGTEAQIDDILGTVKSVSAGQVNVTTPVGINLVLTTNSSTVFNFPAAVCQANNASCLATGQVISADLSLLANGGLQADSISYADAAGTSVAQGVIVSVGTASPTTFQMLVHRVLSDTTEFTPGQIVDVTVGNTAAFSVASGRYPAVAGGTFATSTDLIAGQEVLAEISGPVTTASAGDPAFSCNVIELESSQIPGQVTALNSGAQSFSFTNGWTLFSAASPAITQLQVQTGTQTGFVNLPNFAAVSVGTNARVKGPVFNTTGSVGQPTMAALQVVVR
jgi:hypothetical protein